MSNLSVFQFESKDVRTLTDERDGSVWFVLRDVLAAMGTSTPPNVAKASVEEVFGDEYNKVIPILDSLGRKQNTTIVNEPATTFLISRSNTEIGKKMNRWIHTEVLPSIRKTGSYTAPTQTSRNLLADKLEAATILADALNLTGSSRNGAFRRTVARLDADLLPMIPDYAIDAPVVAGQEGAQSSEACFSLTELLKRSGAKLSAVKANKLLVELGILEEKERPSSKGGTKKFKCITKSGLKYGKNVVSEQNPRETQPQWFESMFDELLQLLT